MKKEDKMFLLGIFGGIFIGMGIMFVVSPTCKECDNLSNKNMLFDTTIAYDYSGTNGRNFYGMVQYHNHCQLDTRIELKESCTHLDVLNIDLGEVFN